MTGSVHNIIRARQTRGNYSASRRSHQEQPFLARAEIARSNSSNAIFFVEVYIHHNFGVVAPQLIEPVTSIIFIASDTPQKSKNRNSLEEQVHS